MHLPVFWKGNQKHQEKMHLDMSKKKSAHCIPYLSAKKPSANLDCMGHIFVADGYTSACLYSMREGWVSCKEGCLLQRPGRKPGLASDVELGAKIGWSLLIWRKALRWLSSYDLVWLGMLGGATWRLQFQWHQAASWQSFLFKLRITGGLWRHWETMEGKTYIFEPNNSKSHQNT
jgi:hypothetical protein